MKLNVPFLPDDDYIAFLNRHVDAIESVHYSLFNQAAVDARIRFESISPSSLSAKLEKLKHVKRYALLNSRFHLPGQYLDRHQLTRITGVLENLINDDLIDGVVYTDHYLLNALSDESRDISENLEAVPSVNCMIDSKDKLQTCLEAIENTNFKLPGKIVPDRSLNRRLEDLSDFSNYCRKRYPEIKIELLANEGCLYHCPYKLSHDCLIALPNLGLDSDRTYDVNSRLGCKRQLQDAPQLLMKSPFIRPEDQSFYSDYADAIKVCGRTLGPQFLKKTVSAYIKGKFEGSLIELLDAMEWMNSRLEIPNPGFPSDFIIKTSRCDKDCATCGYCLDLFEKLAAFKDISLMDFRNESSKPL